MDYRPITLLTTSYKVLDMIARRVQVLLPKLIGPTQQGFVKQRRIDASILQMQSILAMSYEDDAEDPINAPAVLLLDIKKAYDTLDRGFLL